MRTLCMLVCIGVLGSCGGSAWSVRKNQSCEAAFRPYIPSGKVTLVHFWADWCFPCGQVVGRIQRRFGERVLIVGFDADDPLNEGISPLCGHTGIPADMIYNRNGKMIVNASPYGSPLLNLTRIPPFAMKPEEDILDNYIAFLGAVIEEALQ